MPQRKFTVILLPLETGGYQVYFPDYPGCITIGDTVAETLIHAKEAMQLYLEVEAERGGDPVPDDVHSPHVVVGEVDVEVPDSLIEALREAPREPKKESRTKARQRAGQTAP
jgi:predicted RNase H-like HicB family nuclease